MNTQIVFVIGAGASNEVGLPVGSELKKAISDSLSIKPQDTDQYSGDKLIKSALDKLATGSNSEGDINAYLKEANHVSEALPLAISIDNFINSHRGNKKLATCGKLAICSEILKAERKSTLYFNENIYSKLNHSNLEATWYVRFFQLLTEDCNKEDLTRRFSSVTLIIFNYDRCIEHFLFNALKDYYKISDHEASMLVGTINIYHPYGSVGDLPWQDSKYSLSFGGAPDVEYLIEASKRIRTFTEGTDPSESDISLLRQHIKTAPVIAFIGFAYHKLNMKLISPIIDKNRSTSRRCFATTCGISASDKNVILNEIHAIFGPDKFHIQMTDSRCADFFTEFWRGLAFR